MKTRGARGNRAEAAREGGIRANRAPNFPPRHIWSRAALIQNERGKERQGKREGARRRHLEQRGKEKRKEKRAAAPGILAGGAGPRSNCTRTLVQRLPCPSLLLRPIQSAYI